MNIQGIVKSLYKTEKIVNNVISSSFYQDDF